MKEYLFSNKPYIIAETAYTFEGNRDYLLEQTVTLSEEINAIKYHMMFNVEGYVVGEHPVSDLLKSWLIKEEDWKNILQEAKNKKLDTVVLVDDIESVEFCCRNNELIDAIEIHAACVNDIKLLDKTIQFVKEYAKIFIIGISGFEIQELQEIAEYLKMKNIKNVLMMYGFQNFPTDIKNINISKMKILSEITNFKIGYADHTSFSDINKENIISAAFSIGANIQEIHYILEESDKKTDASTAVTSDRLVDIKNNLEIIYHAIGNPDFRLNMGEKKYLDFRKVPVYSKDLKKGDKFDSKCVVFKRVEKPIKQNRFREVEKSYGLNMLKDVLKNIEISESDFEGVIDNDCR